LIITTFNDYLPLTSWDIWLTLVSQGVFNNCWLQILCDMMLLISWFTKWFFWAHTLRLYFVPSVLYKELQKNERIFSKYVVLFCVYVCTIMCRCVCCFLCTPFIADEELCRWSFDLGASSSSLLVAIICALPLWSFPYLFCLSVLNVKEILVLTSFDCSPMSLSDFR
jgi:hypothetical protein